jgi:hypothetical protein
MNDIETVAYAVMGLDYTKKNLWEIYLKDHTPNQTWAEMKDFLLLRLGDPTNQTRNAG